MMISLKIPSHPARSRHEGYKVLAARFARVLGWSEPLSKRARSNKTRWRLSQLALWRRRRGDRDSAKRSNASIWAASFADPYGLFERKGDYHPLRSDSSCGMIRCSRWTPLLPSFWRCSSGPLNAWWWGGRKVNSNKYSAQLLYVSFLMFKKVDICKYVYTYMSNQAYVPKHECTALLIPTTPH